MLQLQVIKENLTFLEQTIKLPKHVSGGPVLWRGLLGPIYIITFVV